MEKEQCLVAGHKGERHAAAVVGLRSKRAREEGGVRARRSRAPRRRRRGGGEEKEQCLVAGHKGAKERRGKMRRSEGERHAAAVVGLRSKRARKRGVDEHAGVERRGGG